MSTWGTVSSFGLAPLVLLAWPIAAGLTIWLMIQRPISTRIRYDIDTGLFHLPGSWIPLMVMMGIFSVKYIVGVTLALEPGLAARVEFSTAASVMYGAMTGIFIGRVGQLWKIRKNLSPNAVACRQNI
jgi:hypothetical protein